MLPPDFYDPRVVRLLPVLAPHLRGTPFRDYLGSTARTFLAARSPAQREQIGRCLHRAYVFVQQARTWNHRQRLG